MISLWPESKANDYFRGALVVLLQRYPKECVEKLNDAIDGIAGEYDRLPKLAQVKKWLDGELKLLVKKAQAQSQLADRPRITKNNFFDQALAYGQIKWTANKKEWPTIAPGETAWEWWEDYFAYLKFVPTAFNAVKEGALARYTVPELEPKVFDSNAVLVPRERQEEKRYVREDQTWQERTDFLNATLKKYGFGPVGSVLRKM